MLARKALAGTAGAPKLYVEDVFSTYLYTGNGSTQTITNNIDLSTEGGLVWLKQRSPSASHMLYDTARGIGRNLKTDATTAQSAYTAGKDLTAFNSNGFSLGESWYGETNTSPNNYASWTFRKAKKFFDVVTFTTNSNSGGTFNHSLGSAPGCIIIKRTDGTANWFVWHRGLTSTNYYIKLNGTDAQIDNGSSWISSTSTSVTIADNGPLSFSSAHVAYLFAHDAGGFGDAGSDNVISCGSYTGNGSTTGPTVTLGYEPQWLLIKRASGGTGNWVLIDSMRGLVNSTTATPSDAYLVPNTTAAEQTWGDFTGTSNAAIPLATGFQIVTSAATLNNNTDTYIYIAIRRGPMKTPTSGTSVFMPLTYNGNNSSQTITGSTGVPDLGLGIGRTGGMAGQNTWYDRLRGKELGLISSSTNAQYNASPGGEGNMTTTMNGMVVENIFGRLNDGTTAYIMYFLSRAPGFFDEVCYTGTGANRTVSHNLGVAPELMIVKRRETANAWAVYANNDNTDYLVLNTTAATVDDNTYWNDTSPTSSVFSVGTNNATNASGSTYVAYLFASLSGVSKIGTYTGNGSSVTVTTNFQPRFILVKRTDSTGDWIVSDSARGLVAGDDPFLKLNSTAAEVTNEDWVDISSTSFTVNQTTNNANVNTGTYLYLAIA